MSTYTQILYQIIFSTKRREKALLEKNRDKLFQYISGIIKNKECHLYQINGVEDHIHILIHLHPSVSLSDLVKDIKVSTSLMIKQEKLFPKFNGWQIGYGAFTYSIDAKENLIRYIVNQKEHHKKENSIDEFGTLLEKFKIHYDKKYFE